MTPEQQAMLEELYQWMTQRKEHQIVYPLDDDSKVAIGAVSSIKVGSKALTQSITIGAGGGSANVPAAYFGTIIVLVNGKQREIPYL
jgi:hypothetical protein